MPPLGSHRLSTLIDTVFRLSSCLVSLSLISIAASASLPAQNITIEVPAGTTNHGNLHLLCTPAQARDILVFFAANYFAHAATVKIYPGERTLDITFAVVSAILFPTSGIVRGLHSIMRHAVSVRDSLQRAARAGALCKVVRTDDWEPEDDAAVSDIRIVKRISDSAKKTKKVLTDSKKKGYKNASTTDEETVELTDISPEAAPTILSTYIPPWLREAPSYWSYSDTKDVYTGNRVCHGKRETPPGYTLAFVPRNAKVVSLAGAETEAEALDSPVISSIYGVAKIGISLFQSLYATYTVYQARGDQITRYGYAAFALTVAPYAVMSTLNLIGNMLTPDYPTLFLVRSEIMAEAEKRKGSRFEGLVGRLVEIPTNSSPELLDGSAFDDVENHVSGTFEVRKDDNGDTKTLWHKREGQHAIAEPNANEANFTSATAERWKLIELRTKVSDEDLPPEYFGVLVPACPRFQRSDDIQVARHFEDAESPVGPSYVLFFATITINAVIIGIVGGLSHFRRGESTTAQRVWTMMWLVFGFLLGFYIAVLPSMDVPNDRSKAANLKDIRERLGATTVIASAFAAPAVGGFVVVAQMLEAYGSCTTIG